MNSVLQVPLNCGKRCWIDKGKFFKFPGKHLPSWTITSSSTNVRTYY